MSLIYKNSYYNIFYSSKIKVSMNYCSMITELLGGMVEEGNVRGERVGVYGR